MKNFTPELIAFIEQHEHEDPVQLLLAAKKYPGTNIPLAVEQIIARKQIEKKIPTWYAQRAIFYPSRLSTEQCSSEITATYKQRLLKGQTLCDLTGGLGVDSYYFSLAATRVYYTERHKEYCDAAQNNFSVLGAKNIQVINGDANAMADTLQADTFYLDPARRGEGNKRVFALPDCEPNVLTLKDNLLKRAQRLILKISPMADITETLRLLPETTEVHIVAVRNECKELLFVLENNPTHPEPEIHAIHFPSQGEMQSFSFTPSSEQDADPRYAHTMATYLYEPNSALLKSGAFKLIASRFGLQKLHPHSHLYTSNTLVPHFPGRYFQVENVHDFSQKRLHQLASTLPKANLTVRNFPLSVAELRKKSKISEGGDTYLFATTYLPNHLVLIQTKKLN